MSFVTESKVHKAKDVFLYVTPTFAHAKNKL